MRRRFLQKVLFSLGLICAILLTPVPVLAADEVSTDCVCGGQAVYVDMSRCTGDVALANDGVAADGNATDMVTDSLAAINGGFFNAYYKTGSFPDDYPQVFGPIIKDGELIHSFYSTNCIGFTYDGKVLIDRVAFYTEVAIEGILTRTVWVNDAEALNNMLMTPVMTKPFSVPEGSKVYTIRDGIVVDEADSGTYTVPEDSIMLVCSDAPEESAKGYRVSITRTCDNEDWDNIRTSLGGGKMLIRDGKDVTGDSHYNDWLESDPKQNNSHVAMRSYAAVMGDGRLLLGTASTSFSKLTDELLNMGCTHALSLDGGASSMLYANDQFLTQAGRKLVYILTIVPQTADPHQPAAWAVSDVNEAISDGLVHDSLQSRYGVPATRSEFCALAAALYEKAMGEEITARKAFSDTMDINVEKMAALGVVNGVGENRFAPQDPLTREQAATILSRLAAVIGRPLAEGQPSFADNGEISTWALLAVGQVQSSHIMNGVGDNRFAPTEAYTREQCIVTILRLSRLLNP